MYLKTIIQQPPSDTFHLYVQILTTPSPPFTGSFLLYKGERLVLSGTVSDLSKTRGLLRALLLGLTYNYFSHHIRIFLPNPAISGLIFRTSKHSELFFSHSITDRLISFLDSNPLHHVDLFRYSIKWSCLPGRALISSLTDRTQLENLPLSSLPLSDPKSLLLSEWQENYLATNRSANYWRSTICPDGQGPPPFLKGALSLKDRHTTSACLQIALGHGFFEEYSQRFRPHAGDNNICPCNHPSHIPGSIIQETSDEGFELLMSEFLQPDPPSSPPSPSASSPPHRAHLPRHQRNSPPPRLHLNTVSHVLAHCPLLTSPRRHIFGHHVNFDFIFGTFDGGRKLGEFLRASNRLLCPLPPRPDPP